MTTTIVPKEGNGAVESSLNPFAKADKGAINAVAEAESQRAVAEIQAAMVIAQRFPRNQAERVDQILNAFGRVTLAEKGMYSYARGGSDISGLSIRAMEAIAQNWGNTQFGIRELEQKNGSSLVQAFAWDVESNTRSEKTFTVPHVRHTKKGQYRLEDPRDIYEAVANQGARRLRSCLQAIIPVDVQNAVEKQIESTLRAKVTINDELISSLIEKFSSHGVSRRALEAKIQRRLEAITPAQVVRLGQIYNSLEDGMGVASDFFELEEQPKETGEQSGSRVDELKKKHGTQVAQTAEPTAAPAESAEPDANRVQATRETPPTAVGDENAKRKSLRTAIAALWKGASNDILKLMLTREFAKNALPDLTTAQLEDLLERTPALLEEYA